MLKEWAFSMGFLWFPIVILSFYMNYAAHLSLSLKNLVIDPSNAVWQFETVVSVVVLKICTIFFWLYICSVGTRVGVVVVKE